MLTAGVIVIACWLILLFYWVISWRTVKPTLVTKWGNEKLILFVIGIIAIWIILNYLSHITSFKTSVCHLEWQGCRDSLFNSVGSISFFLQVINIALSIIGLIIALSARKTLGANWSGRVEIKKNHKLITTGIYHYIRHPIYTGVLSMTLATMLFFNNITGLVLFILILSFMIFKLKQEEKLLIKYFPKDYHEYKSKTKALLPYIF
jgi:protein-S-isoprenylcysteine O-methyltransferase Ste14